MTISSKAVILNWNGNKVIKKKNIAVSNAINAIMSKAVTFAKQNHPGWLYRTGVAEHSIRIKEFATVKKQEGLWGSVWTEQGKTVTDARTGKQHVVSNSNYVWKLEFEYGSFLRKSADVNHKLLSKMILVQFKVGKRIQLPK